MTTVALIDDHELVRYGLAAAVNSFSDYKVILEASNGKEFIEKLAELSEAPEIVLLDIVMPEMNGYETATWLKKYHPAIKIMAISMMDSENAILRMLRSGATGYVLKDSNSKIFKISLDSMRLKGHYINELIDGQIIQLRSLSDEFVDPKITDREALFLRLSCSEKTYKEIAGEMHASPRTIDGYRDSLFEKLHIKSRVGLAIFAMKNGFAKLH